MFSMHPTTPPIAMQIRNPTQQQKCSDSSHQIIMKDSTLAINSHPPTPYRQLFSPPSTPATSYAPPPMNTL
ncbi:hypothetical protein EYC84_004596 [Monilinia fructicola]|uniref:Uncharacterized protein n=1 Tax=Monilinia fructicola TaxID=38448 RepID=A0A5M9K3U4_MONFR|nr:hypothetical protein EYC84_004596 [Monilinia fructicola]